MDFLYKFDNSYFTRSAKTKIKPPASIPRIDINLRFTIFMQAFYIGLKESYDIAKRVYLPTMGVTTKLQIDGKFFCKTYIFGLMGKKNGWNVWC